jgi:hypothetical protein
MVVGKSSLRMPSLTHAPLGAEKFKMMRAEPFGFCRHIMPFTLAVGGLSAGGNGPAANPDVTQSATESVTCSLNSRALGALLLKVGFLASPLHPMSAPSDKSLQTFSSKSSWL